MDEPIYFTYEDTDSFANEISEIYSYSEESEFFANRNAFEESMEDCGLPLTWKHMAPEQQLRAMNYLMTTLEVSCRITRLKSCRAFAYLIQGNFGECLTLEEQSINSQENVFLLYEQGLFQAFVQQLLLESDLSSSNNNINHERSSSQLGQNNNTSSSSSQIFNDSSELRLILSVLCTIVETMYHAKDSTSPKRHELRQQFILELRNPIGDELLTVTLFQMLNNFCSGLAPHFPVRKITILLWKLILIELGGEQTLKNLKETKRKLSNLEPSADDTLEVTKNMRPCSPPLNPDREDRRARSALSAGFVANKRKIFKQSALDDAVFAYAKEFLLAELNHPGNENDNDNDNENENGNDNENETENDNGPGENNEYPNGELNDSTEDAVQNSQDNEIDLYIKSLERLPDDPIHLSDSSDSGIIESGSSESEKTTVIATVVNDTGIDTLSDPKEGLDISVTSDDRPADKESLTIDIIQPPSNETNNRNVSLKAINFNQDQLADCSRSDVTTIYKGLPWVPKVRKADLSQHLSNLRQKFLGYTLPNDLETTFGLPDPIIEGINVLKRHMYISLSEVQLEREEAIERYPLTHKEIEQDYQDAAAERLYSALLPRLPQYMIALLKILLAATQSSKNKSERTESINIMSEMDSGSGSNSSIVQTMKMITDANRHKEIIIKAVSAILILLLKHFKVNHIYQFEYVSQQLMFANCIPLILKFLSQDIYTYIVASKSNIWVIDFPACVIGEQPELTTEAIELCSLQPYCWRNMFSCINLVRILNKLTKWKHSRIMMLVVFKSAPTLTKALSVRHSMFQLYVLKLLKVQLKFLGRQWKKSNMKLISAIYQKVRHRLTDDWAYSNDNEARPWDFQAEEFTLQSNINKFHQRRYQSLLNLNNRSRNGNVFNQQDKIGGYDDCTDEDYDFGNDDINQISPQFERNYDRWLETEVFQRNIDWDKLL